MKVNSASKGKQVSKAKSVGKQVSKIKSVGKQVSKIKSVGKQVSKIKSLTKINSVDKVKSLSKPKITSKGKIIKKKVTVKAIKRVNNNLIFTYAKNAIRFGLPIVTYFSSLYLLNKFEEFIIERHIQRNRQNIQRYIQDDLRINLEQDNRQIIRQRRNAENVHDREVNGQSIDIYNRYPIPRQETVENSLNEMRRLFQNDIIVSNVINLIVQRHARNGDRPIMGLHRTELQCLTTVFINVVGNEDKKNYFSQMLRDCVGGYDGGLVCQTGVVNRIVVALLIDNPDAIPRNFTLEFQNELQNLAIRIRNQVFANNNLQTDDQRTTEFQNILRRQAYENYAENRNITRAQLNEILEPLLEACC